MPKTAFNWHAVLMTAYWLHAVLMTAYSWHAVLMTAFDNLSHACSSIKSIQYTQFEQLTRTSQCLLIFYNYRLRQPTLRHNLCWSHNLKLSPTSQNQLSLSVWWMKEGFTLKSVAADNDQLGVKWLIWTQICHICVQSGYLLNYDSLMTFCKFSSL